jgi:hypothetical protein
MADPITPNIEYGLLDGQVVTTFTSLTATGGTKEMTVNLATYAPWIDIRIGHPVICAYFLTDETNVTGSEVFLPSKEMERGTAPDSTGEWEVVDHNTIDVYQTADQNGFVAITYIAFGGQRA